MIFRRTERTTIDRNGIHGAGRLNHRVERDEIRKWRRGRVFPETDGSSRPRSSALSADARMFQLRRVVDIIVSRAFTVSDVYLPCALPRLVLDEVHHVTLLVHLLFASSHERIIRANTESSLDKIQPVVSLFVARERTQVERDRRMYQLIVRPSFTLRCNTAESIVQYVHLEGFLL